MVEFKVVISDSKGKSTSQELKDKSAQPLLGSKLGDILESSILGFKEGKIKLTGGSDKSGTPMRSDLHGATKKYVLMTRGSRNAKSSTWRKKKKIGQREYDHRRNLSIKLSAD